MPRKPWVRLHRSFLTSTTWIHTIKCQGALRCFIAMLVTCDENGVLDAAQVGTIPVLVWGGKRSRWGPKWDRTRTLLAQIGTIVVRDDGSVFLPKFKEYQYIKDERPNSDYRLPHVLPRTRTEQNRAEQSRTEKDKTPKPVLVPVEIPVELQTGAFRTAWANWVEDRKARKKPMTVRAQQMALKQCAEWGPTEAVAAIEKSIASGWMGLFKPKHDPESDWGPDGYPTREAKMRILREVRAKAVADGVA